CWNAAFRAGRSGSVAVREKGRKEADSHQAEDDPDEHAGLLRDLGSAFRTGRGLGAHFGSALVTLAQGHGGPLLVLKRIAVPNSVPASDPSSADRSTILSRIVAGDLSQISLGQRQSPGCIATFYCPAGPRLR